MATSLSLSTVNLLEIGRWPYHPRRCGRCGKWFRTARACNAHRGGARHTQTMREIFTRAYRPLFLQRIRGYDEMFRQ